MFVLKAVSVASTAREDEGFTKKSQSVIVVSVKIELAVSL